MQGKNIAEHLDEARHHLQKVMNLVSHCEVTASSDEGDPAGEPYAQVYAQLEAGMTSLERLRKSVTHEQS